MTIECQNFEYISIYTAHILSIQEISHIPHTDGKYPSYRKAKGSQVHIPFTSLANLVTQWDYTVVGNNWMNLSHSGGRPYCILSNLLLSLYNHRSC